MTLTIDLSRELEESLRTHAEHERRSVEEVVSRQLQEAELLQRIFSYFPVEENREFRSLARRHQGKVLQDEEARRYAELAHLREVRNTRRLADLIALSRLRSEPLRRVMEQLGIRPLRLS